MLASFDCLKKKTCIYHCWLVFSVYALDLPNILSLLTGFDVLENMTLSVSGDNVHLLGHITFVLPKFS